MNLLPTDHEPGLFGVACPTCEAAIAVSSTLAGCAVACPHCGAGFMAPQPSVPAAFQPTPFDPFPEPQLEPVAIPLDTSEPPPRIVRDDGEVIELRRLTAVERRGRRTRRTILTIGAGTAILFTIVLAASRGGGKRKNRMR